MFLDEKLTRTQMLGIGFALVAIVFLSQETPPVPEEISGCVTQKRST